MSCAPIFAESATVGEKIREFRAGAYQRIHQGDTPVTLLDGGVLAVHVIPFSAATGVSSFAFREAAAQPNLFPTILDNYARQFHLSFDGLTVTSNGDTPPKPQRAYTQVFRTGAVEGVASSISTGGNALVLPHMEAIIVRYARLYMQSLVKLAVEPPFAVLATLDKVKGFRILQDFVPGCSLGRYTLPDSSGADLQLRRIHPGTRSER